MKPHVCFSLKLHQLEVMWVAKTTRQIILPEQNLFYFILTGPFLPQYAKTFQFFATGTFGSCMYCCGTDTIILSMYDKSLFHYSKSLDDVQYHLEHLEIGKQCPMIFNPRKHPNDTEGNIEI